jgi:hypothetical protein
MTVRPQYVDCKVLKITISMGQPFVSTRNLLIQPKYPSLDELGM